jgi:hypothetical protein
MTPHTELALPTTPSPSILLRGDEIDTLRDFARMPNVLATLPIPGRTFRRRPVQAVATGVDAISPELTVRGFRSRLRRELLPIQRLCDWLPQLKHVIFIVFEPKHLRESAVGKAADGFAEDTHAHLERVCGAYITVTVLLVSDCDHPGLLAERIDQRASSRPVDPYLALPWRSLVEESIQQSAVAAYC